jgi:hypothetical protein
LQRGFAVSVFYPALISDVFRGIHHRSALDIRFSLRIVSATFPVLAFRLFSDPKARHSCPTIKDCAAFASRCKR